LSDNPAQPPPGVDLCALDDLPDPGAKGFRFREGAKMFAGFIVRRGEAVLGYVDSCPHAGWPLAAFDDRYLTRDGALILCAGHAALFRPEDGACVAGPCAGEALTPWPVKVEAGRVLTA
jgi:nitrite reductase/ring-hydroxylating ferredoxin subunit